MKNGFTLIEFMIIFAILGVLAAIAVPEYLKWTNRKNLPAEDPGTVAETCIKSVGRDQPCFRYIGELDGCKVYEYGLGKRIVTCPCNK